MVIHGVGAHSPLETLDLFARNFCDGLETLDNIQYLHRFDCGEGDENSYVEVRAPGSTCLQFHEYTWDFSMTRDIKLEEVLAWMKRMVEGAKNFYKYNPKKDDHGSSVRSDVFDQKGEYRAHRYLGLISGVWRLVSLVVKIVDFLPVPGVAKLLTALIKTVRVFYRKFAKGFFGDLVTYICTDVRSPDFAVSKHIQNGALEKILSILAKGEVDQIILVGHSLGSVIAYDALNLLNHRLDRRGGISREEANKVTGLITFGSPLDKVVFTHYSGAEEDAHLHWQILDHLRSFKSRPINIPEPKPGKLVDPLSHDLNDYVTWFNFYHRKDPVSGSLDAYLPDENIRFDVDTDGVADAHTFYWKHPPMYKKIMETFFSDANAAPTTGG